LEYDWFGVAQSILNRLCDRPNVWFERLTSPGVRQHPASTRDAVISTLLGPPITAVSLPLSMIDWALGGGATLTMTARSSPAPV
jgi:hypothetical protein